MQPYVRPLPKEALAKGSMTLSKKDKVKLEKEGSGPKWPYGGGEIQRRKES